MAHQQQHLPQLPGTWPNTHSSSQLPTAISQRWHPLPNCSPFPCSWHEILLHCIQDTGSCHAHHEHTSGDSVSLGTELKQPCQPWGCPVVLPNLQAAGDIYYPGSSPSSSPLIVRMAKETNSGWWYTLLFTLKCSCLSPRKVVCISTLLQQNRKCSELLHFLGFQQQNIYVTVVRVSLGVVWPYYPSSGHKLTHPTLHTKAEGQYSFCTSSA